MTPDAKGSHLSNFERTLGKYIISLNYGVLTSLEDLASATVEHEDYYMSDSGTSWPADTTVVYHLFNTQVRKNGTRSAAKRKNYAQATSSDPVEFMRDLLNDFTD